MNHSGGGHLKGMALISGGVFVVLLLLGKPAGEALSYAVLLACPLMMVGMMFGGHAGHGASRDDSEHEAHTGHLPGAGSRDPDPAVLRRVGGVPQDEGGRGHRH